MQIIDSTEPGNPCLLFWWPLKVRSEPVHARSRVICDPVELLLVQEAWFDFIPSHLAFLEYSDLARTNRQSRILLGVPLQQLAELTMLLEEALGEHWRSQRQLESYLSDCIGLHVTRNTALEEFQ